MWLSFIRFLLFIVATYNLQVEQIDVEIVFLHWDLEEALYELV